SYNWFVESGVKLSTHENDTTIHITPADHTKWDDIATSGIKYTWAYNSMLASGNEIYAAYKHSANTGIHSFNVVNYITSTNSINRFYPSTLGKATSGSVHSLWNWSSNKSWYANSSNVRLRFPASSTAINRYYPSTMGHSDYLHSSNANKHLTSLITTPRSGQILQYFQDNARWQNVFAPLTYSIANVKVSAQQFIELAKFRCPTNTDGSSKKVYIWQAHAANSSQASIHGLFLQVLSGTTNQKIRFRTSSATLRQGYPISSTTGGNTTIRFGYSSSTMLTGVHFGTAGIQLSVI
ncbi:MAG: hypothetical protein IMZ59_07180, partial [Actinobacteria bacterium]|nr:hypothetical protein [Actinomycetota bacterium]